MSHSITEIEHFIKLIREAVPNAVQVFTKGNCTSFARILNIAFPGGRVLHNLDHAVYQYKDNCFDITGEVRKPERAMPIEDYGLERMASLMQNNYK